MANQNPEDGAVEKYGRLWYPRHGQKVTDLRIELDAYAMGLKLEDGGLGKARHYRNVVTAIWPAYAWHKWAELRAQAFCMVNEEVDEATEAKFVRSVTGLAGGTDSGKSWDMAAFALVNWFADPLNTMCIVVSTSKIDAKQRIWSALVKMYREAQAIGVAPGRLIESMDIIKLSDEEGKQIDPEVGVSDASSIMLLAAGDEFKDDAQKRLQGKKNKRIALIIDELQDCSASVINEAIWGFKGAQELYVVGAGNPSSIFDPHGKFCEPIKGWMSVDEDISNWKIKVAGIEGLCLRFDSEKDNPNEQSFKDGKGLRYPFLPKPNDVAIARKELGELNPQYWRKFRGFWPPSDADDSTIVSDILLARHGGLDKPIWDGTPKDIAGIDPSYTEGGDRFVFTHMKYGKLITGKWAIAVEKQYVLNRRAGSNQDFQYEMIEQIYDLSKKLSIPNQWMGVDASAGGIFWSIGERELLKGWHSVSFAGAASDLPVSAQYAMRNEETGKPQVGKELFHNMSSELCFVTRYFLECEQLKGINSDLAWEMTQRKYARRNRKIIIESKTDMKKRIGKSPDLFDSFAVGLFVARKVFGAMAGSEAIEEKKRINKETFKKLKHSLTLRSNW
jgi:hypothetical protein